MKDWKIFKNWWWHSTGFHLHTLTWKGLKNVIKWLPIVWKDRDWDHVYITDVLKFKIKNTADYIEEHKRYEGWERDVERMRMCVRIMDKLDDGFYEHEYQDYHKTVFEFEKIEMGLTEMKGNVISNNLPEYFAKYPNDYRRLSEKWKETELTSALMMSSNRHMRATKILFEIISTNIYGWWD